MGVSRLLSGCSIWIGVAFSSSFSGFGAFDRKEFFGCNRELSPSDGLLEIEGSEGSELWGDLRPVLDLKRSSLAECNVVVEVEECDVERCWSESVESSLEVTRTARVRRRGSRIGESITDGSFPFSSFPNLCVDADDSRREIEALR